MINLTNSDYGFDMNSNQKYDGGFKKQGFSKIPLISIVTAVFNGEKYLEETIQSVINQTNDNVEYIIIDGGSTDRTLDIIKRYEDKIDHWISEPDDGIYDAWNKGISLARGSWIGFLGADDIYMEDALLNYAEKISEDANIEYISTQVVLCDEFKQKIRVFGSQWNWDDFSKYMNVAHVGSLHKISLYEKYGLYDLSFKMCGDYELLLRAKDILKTGYINKISAYMRCGGVSNNNIKIFEEVCKAKIKHSTRAFNFLAKLDMYIAILKWKVRKIIWY